MLTVRISSQSTSLKSQPLGIAAATPGIVFAAFSDSISILENSKAGTYKSTKFGPTAIAATTNGLLAVGGDVRLKIF